MKVSIGCDHIVTDKKDEMVNFIESLGHEVIDNGTYDYERTHYPIYAKKTAERVLNGEADVGVVICGTGVGIGASSNKVKGIRSALVRDVTTAVHAKEDWNANIIGVGGRIVGQGLMEEIVETFLNTDYVPTAEKESLIQALEGPKDNDGGLNDENFFDDLLEKWDRGEYHNQREELTWERQNKKQR
ncbi:galactose-6-phosphate isomerase subunit LacB [Salisediminibacterium halotolerans]|uniref:Galactose-6-phosphate isomerase n=1 Tax=Salisediminibacterium halotolerans TaxID=517425 RepID=A0A1H9U740_9BACI|nr:galactose-6-phosphate isomerase subunit LacB [Salisediminibacterium haloalkalitolerans]SES05296.1 galactose-6-phosphate isomerase [Salisediminibacterium haloalkalitolerans]